MTRRDAIIHVRALLAAGDIPPGWRAALTALVRTAEAVERAHRKRVRATGAAQRSAMASTAAGSRWATMTPAERSAEMRRRAGVRARRKAGGRA